MVLYENEGEEVLNTFYKFVKLYSIKRAMSKALSKIFLRLYNKYK